MKLDLAADCPRIRMISSCLRRHAYKMARRRLQDRASSTLRGARWAGEALRSSRAGSRKGGPHPGRDGTRKCGLPMRAGAGTDQKLEIAQYIRRLRPAYRDPAYGRGVTRILYRRTAGVWACFLAGLTACRFRASVSGRSRCCITTFDHPMRPTFVVDISVNMHARQRRPCWPTISQFRPEKSRGREQVFMPLTSWTSELA